jgi:hypothetical protein
MFIFFIQHVFVALCTKAQRLRRLAEIPFCHSHFAKAQRKRYWQKE